MKVTASEIRQREFALRFRGYDPAEVDTFLELVAGQVEDLAKENARLREALARQEGDSQRLRQGEDDWKKALMAAQQIREDLIGRGQQQAELILAEAELKVEQMLTDAKRHLEVINHDVQVLTHQRHQLVGQLRHLLEQHLALLDAQQGESAEQRRDNLPTPLPQASEPSDAPGKLAPAAGGMREIVNKGTGRKSRRSSATAAK